MAINYNLSIGSLNRKLSVGNLTNVIYEVTVGVSAQSEEYPQFTYSCGGTVGFNISELESESFIPFDEITQEIIVEWLLAKEEVDSIEEFSYVKYSLSNIQDRIDALQLEDSVPVGWNISNVSTTPEVVEPIEEEIIEEEILDDTPVES